MLCKQCQKDRLEGVVCGQAFTDWTCLKCGKTFVHHNTATPKICKCCSKKYSLCEECGQEIKNGN